MQISPAYASKLIRQKNEQIRLLLAQEKELSTTTACLDEDVTKLRGQYNFSTFQEKVETLNREVVALKHACSTSLRSCLAWATPSTLLWCA